MKQVLQSLRTGVTELAEVPAPQAERGQVLIRSRRSLISAGTERMLVEFGKAGILGKARQQPDRVRDVLDKCRTDGLAPTLDAVFAKLDEPLPLGYCNVGTVLEAGPGVTAYKPGDRVASNGPHAQAIAVPVNLTARVPDGVSDDAAAFTVIGAIALQGLRLAAPTLGESVVVTGLGLVGLMTVQLLKAQGCRVLGLDFDPARLKLARDFGAETLDLSNGADPLAAAHRFSRRLGVDAVLITAATASNEPVHQAAQMCRKRGRIVLVGVAGLALSRADFYEKELTFQVSCSYGPGRHDPGYEDKGQDYPIGYVRWTEGRNFEAVLDMLAAGRLDIEPLISHRFAIEAADAAYGVISGKDPSLGVLITYPDVEEQPDAELLARSIPLNAGATGQPTGKAAVGFIGAGNYARAMLIPAFAATPARLVSITSARGVSGVHAGRKFGFASTTTDVDAVLADPGVNAVVIATRHDSHADLVCRGVAARKHVFVEKPLALTYDDLDRIAAAREDAIDKGFVPVVMVGFNRRFAPLVVEMQQRLAGVASPKSFVMTVNAGAIPAGHWVHDPEAGGGRLIGEACHFIDLLRCLAAWPVTSHHAVPMTSDSGDTATIQLGFADGSIGTVHYFANGSKAFPKERLEVFAGNRVLQLDNFRRLTGFGWPGFRRKALWRQDKGQKACAAAFVAAVQDGGAAPIAFDEIIEVSRLTIEVAAAVRTQSPP